MFAKARSLACFWLLRIAGLLVRIQFPSSVVIIFCRSCCGSLGNRKLSLSKQYGCLLIKSLITFCCCHSRHAFCSISVCPCILTFLVSHSVMSCCNVVSTSVAVQYSLVDSWSHVNVYLPINICTHPVWDCECMKV